jgi:hypothetical protein
VVFQHRKKVKSAEQWCFSIGKKVKSVEQWCFSIGKNDEGLLVMVFQQQKRKGETIAGRSCFVDENGEEMGTGVFWEWEEKVLKKHVEQWCFSIGKNSEKLLKGCNGVSATEGKRRNNCWTELFRR